MPAVLDYSASHVSTVAYTELIDVSEAKERLRITDDISDADLLKQITRCRIQVERDTRRSFVAHTYDFAYDCFPDCRYIRFAGYTPLVSVTHLKYIDQDGTLTTWATSNYEVDEARDTIWLAYNVDWPAIRDIQNAVQIRAVFGHVSTDEEREVAKAALLMLLGHWNLNREAGIPDGYGSIISGIVKRSYP